MAGEAVPDAMLELLAGQIGCDATDFASYAARPTTLREHRAAMTKQLAGALSNGFTDAELAQLLDAAPLIERLAYQI